MPQPTSKPLHERLPILGRARARLREGLFRLLERLAATDDARSIADRTVRGLNDSPPFDLAGEGLDDQPYADLGQACRDRRTSDRAPIIITSRFRSGSTLLWNVFRAIEGCSAYYEPFNERRWFDPAARGEFVDSTHRNVDDYWREYDGLTMLGEHYCEDWIRRHLYMDERSWDPAMKRYVDLLIEKAPGRPVLQFNRIDFRLAWFRANYPDAKLVHLYRHPRDQFLSSLGRKPDFPTDGRVCDFGPWDKFYLRRWVMDLKRQFPFLDENSTEHPYRLYYFVWKLSYLFGKRYCDYSLSFEDLIADPRRRVGEMLEVVDVRCDDLSAIERIFANPKVGKWRDYADADWFSAHEEACEETLADWMRQRASNHSRPAALAACTA